MGSTAVIEMTPDSYCVKFIDLSWISWIVHLSSTCNSWCSEDMRYPSSPANGEEREALCSGSADDDEEEEEDDRLQGNGTLTVSDRGFHCCASSSVWPSSHREQHTSCSTLRPLLLPGGSFFTGVSMEINSVSDADRHSYDHLFHGSAAEACRNAVSPPQATGSTLR